MAWRGFILGTLFGGMSVGSIYFLSDIAKSFDQGITVTYMADEMDALRNESDVLRQMAEPHWLGQPADESKNRLMALGLLDFEKPSEGLAAGPVFLKLKDGKIIEIQTHCARLNSDGCKHEGVN